MKHVFVAKAEREADGRYSVDFPDAPGCVTMGEDFTDAIDMAREALEAYWEGEAIIPPRPVETQVAEVIAAGGVPIVIDLDHEAPIVRANLSVRQDVLERIDAAAERLGMSRSSFLVEGARLMMRREENRAG